MFDLFSAILFFMIIGAVVALWTDDLLSAVISLGAVGFGVSVLFLLLRAPDVALTQIVVEVLTLVILIRATIGCGVRTTSGLRDLFGLAVTVMLLAVLFTFALNVLHEIPPFGTPAFVRNLDAASMEYLRKGLGDTGAANIVTAVLLDFRGYDTLGEATVLFTAIVGALALLRRKNKPDTMPEGSHGGER